MGIASRKLGFVVFLLAAVLADVSYAQGAGPDAGRTFRFWSPGHGSQVEYIGPRGQWAFLWYPGNRGVIASRRQTTLIRGVPSVCHLWPPRTYNPVTRERGPGWSCTPRWAWQANVVEVAPGDVFGLAHNPGTAHPTPFSLPREPMSLAQLRQMTGRAR
jgi:hypothetical protein